MEVVSDCSSDQHRHCDWGSFCRETNTHRSHTHTHTLSRTSGEELAGSGQGRDCMELVAVGDCIALWDCMEWEVVEGCRAPAGLGGCMEPVAGEGQLDGVALEPHFSWVAEGRVVEVRI